MEPRSGFQGMNSASICSLAGRYNNPIPTRFLAPLDRLKIPALYVFLPAFLRFCTVCLSVRLKLFYFCDFD